MRLHGQLLATVVVIGSLSAPLGASQSNVLASGMSRPAAQLRWDADRANPYSRLFKPGLLASTPTAPARPSIGVTGQPEIKCGMTMIPIDPRIDPKMAIPAPPSSTKFTIRAVEPTICR